ncbi:MAG: hypothetical protein ACRCX7_11475 [Cetobacterium sp.]|uniref:hypothetical protein n=1 Tax=Cetobacterium sp. TaxID=2071632 RepID=UPI003F2E98C8
MTIEEFLNGYNFKDFTDKHADKIRDILANNYGEDYFDCGGYCSLCPFSVFNNTYNSGCGSGDNNAMIGFDGDGWEQKATIIMQGVLLDYNSIDKSFWEV